MFGYMTDLSTVEETATETIEADGRLEQFYIMQTSSMMKTIHKSHQ